MNKTLGDNNPLLKISSSKQKSNKLKKKEGGKKNNPLHIDQNKSIKPTRIFISRFEAAIMTKSRPFELIGDHPRNDL